jgi:hypothetical protein
MPTSALGRPADAVRALMGSLRRRRGPGIAGLVNRACRPGAGDVLVEIGVPLVAGDGVLVVGADPLDDRVTCLADLRAPGSLPSAAFDVVALTDARPTWGWDTFDNAVRALRPGGVLVCGSSLPLRRRLDRFADVRGHGVGPWRVIEARVAGRADA